MTTELLFLFGGLLLVVDAVLHIAERRRELDAAAQKLGLSHHGSARLNAHPVDFLFCGRRHGLWVEVGQYTESGDLGGTSSYLSVAIPGAASFNVRRKSTSTTVLPSFRTGDEAFDDALAVDGDEPLVRATLTDAVRARLMRENRQRRDGFAVVNGTVELGPAGHLSANSLERWIDEGVSLAQSLAAPADVTSGLAFCAEHDSNTEVRILNLETLVSCHLDAEVTLGQLHRALSSTEPEERLAAAVHLKTASAVAALEALVVGEGQGVASGVRAAALEELVRRRSSGLEPLVQRALTSGPSELCLAAIGAVGELGDVARLPLLHSLVWVFSDGERLALIDALVRLSHPRCEETLLVLLGAKSGEVQRRAARALGMVGSLRAVAPLLPLTRSLLSRGGLTEAARDAVRAIQARQGDAREGGLQLAVDEAGVGALSTVEGRGSVSTVSNGERPGRPR